MIKLQKVKEALEDVVEVHDKVYQSYLAQGRVVLNNDPRVNKAREALVELNGFMQRLESEELIKEIGDAIMFETPFVCIEERENVAQAVINVINE